MKCLSALALVLSLGLAVGVSDAEAKRIGGGKSTDITARIGNIDFTSEANVSAGSGFRIAPSFTYGPNPDSAYYLTLSLEKAGATQTTGFELGYRRRF